MSYASATRIYPAAPPRPPLGVLDPGQQKSYYIALIETYNENTHIRQYAWSNYRYIDFWDANSWSFTFQKSLGNSVRQAAIMYQWTGTGWAKVIDDTTTM